MYVCVSRGRNVIFLGTFVYLLNGWAIALHKIYHNAGFQWPVFFRIRTESYILSLYGRIQVIENPYSRILYEVLYTTFIITPELNVAMIWIFDRKLNMVTIWQHQKKFVRYIQICICPSNWWNCKKAVFMKRVNLETKTLL